MSCSFSLCCFRLCEVFDGDSLAGVRFVMRMPRRSRDLHIANKAVVDHDPLGTMSKRYEQEQGGNAKKIKALRLELKKDESKRMDAELIDHIEVYHAEKQAGVTNQRVDIHYNCIGAFDVPDRRKIPEADIIMETRKGVALSYAPEQVAV